ncbi:group I truncated hemoglobin [Paraglaciecola aestuariivivens]
MKNILVILIFGLCLSACANTQLSTYQQLGGEPKVAEIVDNFITEIEYDPIMFEFFKDSNINRFREKLIEHLCHLTGGPCEYTGDSMEQVHAGMDISESVFNHGVDLFIKAMDKAEVPHQVQNQVLATMIHTREQMLYK